MIWSPDYFRNDHAHYLAEARGMSIDDLKMRLEQLRNLSDDPDENISTGETQLMYSAYVQALEEKEE